MRIAGQYVGWGIGDSDPGIRLFKAHLRKRFTYCANLRDNGLYDQQMVDAVVEMQKRYNASGQLKTGKYIPGVVNAEVKYVSGFLPRPVIDRRPVLFTVCGTGVPWWVGPDADTARAVEAQYLWQPVGYPATAVPMGGSISAARDELYVQMNKHRDRVVQYGCAWAGYSQGAIAVSESFCQEVRPENGRLHWAMPHIRKAVTWGNPCREKGKVWPDAGAPPSPPEHQGVTDTLMTNTPGWWRNYAHVGDLYADSPDDKSGENRRAIWKMIRNGDMMNGPDSLLRQFLELGMATGPAQIAELTGMFKAMIDAISFFGQQTAPHTNYSTAEAISYLKAA